MVEHHCCFTFGSNQSFLTSLGHGQKYKKSTCLEHYLACYCLGTLVSRNDIIFNNVGHSLTHILDTARVYAWLWTKHLSGLNLINYSDRISKSLACLNIIL
ncbi:hypothetical protein Lalb_Chr02g0155841 [Lupinus albus]|uniref:Uncharacterized protein n=1 Tax=Lupinus albus TaxID=3870 RepID=A0A6A4R0W4_LUPAL|nr:hypothetical protein Lalb_Chr02g0155841 [Lupinus albus]